YQEFIDRYGESEFANMAYYRRGHILQFYLKQHDEAVACFETLIGRYPDAMTRAEAYLGLARTYRAMGREERALTIVRTLVEKFPDSLSTEEAKIEFKL
ncbi:MAG TPA: tetratricopeptide repeat protein, partial [Spirochaetota bacterium]|nr:tetratricopeptide repeat protein [Spirochaetota bacterium]